jgi:hypothetical protein
LLAQWVVRPLGGRHRSSGRMGVFPEKSSIMIKIGISLGKLHQYHDKNSVPGKSRFYHD